MPSGHIWPRQRGVLADFPGFVVRTVRESFDSKRLCLFLQGAPDDINPYHAVMPLAENARKLCALTEGYISNPLSPQDEANQIPTLTMADYLWNPEAYDPRRSIGQAVAHLGKTAGERLALKGLVDLYPGRLVDRSFSTGWNSLQERFRLALERDSEKAARKIILHAQAVSQRMTQSFPNRFVRARKVLEADIKEIQAGYSKKH